MAKWGEGGEGLTTAEKNAKFVRDQRDEEAAAKANPTMAEKAAEPPAEPPPPAADPIDPNDTRTVRPQNKLIGSLDSSRYTYDSSKAIQAHKFISAEPDKFGVPSMFNPYALFIHPSSFNDNQVIQYFSDIDNAAFPKNIGGIDSRNLTLTSLLTLFDPKIKNEFNKRGSAPYYANDFLYAKYYDLIPLNQMITLRRFPFPTFDSLKFAKEAGDQFRPLAQAITYFGEPTDNKLSDILKFKGDIKWESIEGPDFEKVEGNEQDFNQSPFPSAAKGIGKLIGANASNANTGKGYSGAEANSIELQNKIADAPMDYLGHVLGPVNVVTKTMVRGRGIGADHTFALVFNYDAKSFNNVNPRLAMLDIIFNMLSLSFNNAKFWGGANRYVPGTPQFGFFGDQKKFYSGDYSGYFDSVKETVSSGLGNLGGDLMNAINSIIKGDLSSLKGLIGKGLGGIMDAQSHKTRPNTVAFKAILTGLPVGEWHMCVGNPLKPIAMIGNLICEGFEMELGGPLTVDDFPSELKFTINMKFGRPRDKGDIEALFRGGEGRGYYPTLDSLDVGNTSASTSGDGKPAATPKKKTGNLAGGSVY